MGTKSAATKSAATKNAVTTKAPATAETISGVTIGATATAEAPAVESMVTVRCLHRFRDKYTRKLHHKGDVWTATKARFTELTSGDVKYVEEETENG